MFTIYIAVSIQCCKAEVLTRSWLYMAIFLLVVSSFHDPFAASLHNSR